MSNNDEMIAKFTEATGTNTNDAQFYLQNSNWVFDDALTAYLKHQNETGQDNQTIRRTTENEAAAPSHVTDQPTNSTKNQAGASKGAKPKVTTFRNMSHLSSSEDEQSYYAGGTRSGQQVIGPRKKTTFSEKLTEMFNQANADGNQQQTHSGTSEMDWGVGHRLGQADTHNDVVKNIADDTISTTLIIRLWSDGFTINREELRRYDKPKNKEFLETVLRGELPTELMQADNTLSVDVEDHRDRDYNSNFKTILTFRGNGQVLGSPSLNLVQENIKEELAPAASNKENEKSAADNLKVDRSERTTQLQIRMADGTRIIAQFNLTHTVGDIRKFVQTARPQYADRPFSLVSSFPTREIEDDSITIEKAGLSNSTIMQRPK